MEWLWLIKILSFGISNGYKTRLCGLIVDMEYMVFDCTILGHGFGHFQV